MKYDRNAAVAYAREFAMSKNPDYYFFGGIGGDCTNFVSQCLHAGGFNMIYDDIDGWFYVNSSFRSASWTGVEFFRRFLLNDLHFPKGEIVGREDVEIGDIIFLNDGRRYYHSLFITKIEDGEIYICSHSDPSLDRPLSTYRYFDCDFVHILD